MRLAFLTLILVPVALPAQTAESLRARIEVHYKAIHAGDAAATFSHHLPEMTIFPGNGHVLIEAGWSEAAARMGTQVPFPEPQVSMRHFAAQIHGNVGIATFYLDGTYGDGPGTWRVSAVWVWRNGQWMEAHHHESRLAS